MKLGIVGLPNVGKSTLFNSLTKAGALSANYPFATIDPNVGIVSVPDERIVKLGELYHTKKVTPATIEFVDIAGLVKGASKGEGLGNQFLANIREVDAIVHVVRCFEDTNIIHVDGSVDPARDIETINLELIFSDVEILDRRIAKIAKQARMDKTLAKELELVEAVKAHLEDGKMARTFEVPDDEDAQLWFKGYNLLTAKPTIYAANVSEDDLADDGASNPHVAKVREMAKEEGAEVFVICAQIEQELADLDEDEKKEYLEDLGVESSGLDKLVAASYSLLGLISFLTAGEDECRAWLVVMVAYYKRRNILKNEMWQLLLISVIAILWDRFTGWKGWSVDFVIPFGILAVQFSVTVIAKINRLEREEYLFYLVQAGIAGLIPMILVWTGIVQFAVPSVICAGISFLTLAALFIFCKKDTMREFHKKLRM